MLPIATTVKPIKTIGDLQGRYIRDIHVDDGKLFIYFIDGTHVFFTAKENVLSCLTHERIDINPGHGAPNRVMFTPKKVLTLYDPLDPRSMLED